IIKDIGRAIAYLRSLGQIAVVLVEQYLDFARELGDHFAVMDRGAIVYSCSRDTMDEAALKRAMAILALGFCSSRRARGGLHCKAQLAGIRLAMTIGAETWDTR